jgi:hypothetical protein
VPERNGDDVDEACMYMYACMYVWMYVCMCDVGGDCA